MLVCGLAAPAPAEAVTLRDLVDLARQGMGDDLLIALVEAEKSVFHLSAADVKSLKEQGLSDRLLIHLLQTPSLRPEPAPRLHIADASPAPVLESGPVVIIERVDTIAVPVFVPVAVERAHRRGPDRRRAKPAAAEYWGYGGKLRPDAWGQPIKNAGKDPERDPKKDPKKK
ncbi:MAG TPA: hypothetical protein VFZ36_09125 [Vicinamibacterales bacterium]